MDVFIGEIILFSGGFQIKGFAPCDEQLLQINQNQALFAVLGTTYGGNGTQTFALPDLRGRVAVGFDDNRNYPLGKKAGKATIMATAANLPAHTHSLNAFSEGPAGNVAAPQGALLANTGTGDEEYRTSGTLVDMGATAIGSTGGGALNAMQPYLAINYQIALQGIFPSRN